MNKPAINKPTLAASALSILLMFSSFSWSNDADTVTLYPAITSGGSVFIEGRVIERKSGAAPSNTDRKRDNFRRNVDLMLNSERKHYPVSVQLGSRKWDLTTDQEGYFRTEADNIKELTPGWHVVSGKTAQGEGTTEVLVVPIDNTHGIISDIDDTVQVTEVNSKRQMMSNTFLNNATQRKMVAGIVGFYQHLSLANPQPALSPIVYLSASPRQLHTAIASFLDHNKFPRGVLVTKRVTDDRTSEPIANQVAYKTKKIEGILAQLPGVRFTLIGDDGERDPEIYADIQKRFADRVEAIWIRQVNPDPKRKRIAGQGVLNEELKKYVGKVTSE